MVAVKSYFDGSEIPPKSLTLAAVAADATTWTRFEASWEEIRKSMGNPPYVHMTDLMPYKGFTNPIGGIHWFSGLTNHESLSPWDPETANCELSIVDFFMTPWCSASRKYACGDASPPFNFGLSTVNRYYTPWGRASLVLMLRKSWDARNALFPVTLRKLSQD